MRLTGTTLDGQDWSVAEESGSVVVINVWGSWCGPCVAEAPDLQKAWDGLSKAGKPVQFMGIDFREAPERGAAFLKANNITYPSLTDESGVLILALQGKAPHRAHDARARQDRADRRPGQRRGLDARR